MNKTFKYIKRIILNILNISCWTLALLIFTPFMSLLYTKIPFPKPKPVISTEEIENLRLKEEIARQEEYERQLEQEAQRELDLLEKEGFFNAR